MASPSFTSGRLQLYIFDQWSNICGDIIFSPFSLDAASVACRQLGYTGASSATIAGQDRSARTVTNSVNQSQKFNGL